MSAITRLLRAGGIEITDPSPLITESLDDLRELLMENDDEPMTAYLCLRDGDRHWDDEVSYSEVLATVFMEQW